MIIIGDKAPVLPARGQRTHSNARTRKGKAIAIAGKKLTPLKK